MQTSLIGANCVGKMLVRWYVGERPDVDVDGEIVAVSNNFVALVTTLGGRLYEVDLTAQTTKVAFDP